MTLAILWPTFALVALVFAVWAALFYQRLRHLRAHPPAVGTFASGEAARRYFEPAELPANNLANLFELPVLYFALVPLLMLTRHANHAQVILAWAFVVLRALHSLLHIGGRVRPRFRVYLASCAVLMAMWIGFAIDMIAAASQAGL